MVQLSIPQELAVKELLAGETGYGSAKHTTTRVCEGAVFDFHLSSFPSCSNKASRYRPSEDITNQFCTGKGIPGVSDLAV